MMAPGPQNEFSHFLRRVVMQFQSYVAQPLNLEIIKDDQPDLVSLFVEVSTVVGDVNKLLQHHTEIMVRAGWFFAKYSGHLTEISRESTTNYNLLYSAKRGHGYGEWDAKRMVETDKTYLEQIIRRDRLQVLVNVLKLLVDACKERLSALQQISNNYRAEIREATI